MTKAFETETNWQVLHFLITSCYQPEVILRHTWPLDGL